MEVLGRMMIFLHFQVKLFVHFAIGESKNWGTEIAGITIGKVKSGSFIRDYQK